MKQFSLIVIFCFLFVIGCESTKEVINPTLSEVFTPSPIFMSGDREMVGIEGNIGILGAGFIAKKRNKYMWHFWGTTKELGQKPFRVEAINLKTKEKVKALFFGEGFVWEYDDLLMGSNNGADAHLPTNMELPTSGLWKLDAYLGGKLKGSIIVDVKEK